MQTIKNQENVSNNPAVETKTSISSPQGFSVPQKVLSVILSSMQPICTKRTALPLTESVLFQVSPRELVIKSTDTDVSLQASIAIESSLTTKAEFLLHGKRLFDLVRELSGDLEFIWDGKSVSIKAGSGNLGISLAASEVGDFPPFPERIENLMDLDADFLKSVLDKVAGLVPQNNANPALNGLCVECKKDGISFVATDGHSLAVLKTKKYSLEKEATWIVPKRAILELKKTLEASEASRVFLGICDGQLVFSGGNFNFFTRLIADKFPAYESILERKNFETGTIARDVFVGALRRAGCLLAGRFVSTQFYFSANKTLTLSVNNKEVGSLTEEVSLEEFGKHDVTNRFYSPYVLSAAQAAGGEKILFSAKDGASPIFIESSDEETSFTYLVMPVLEGKD
jgi:DNA polymerase III subunit beta